MIIPSFFYRTTGAIVAVGLIAAASCLFIYFKRSVYSNNFSNSAPFSFEPRTNLHQRATNQAIGSGEWTGQKGRSNSQSATAHHRMQRIAGHLTAFNPQAIKSSHHHVHRVSNQQTSPGSTAIKRDNFTSFLEQFKTVLYSNDIENAIKIAKRIKNTFFIEETSQESPLLDLPEFHKSIISILNDIDTAAAAEARKILKDFYYADCSTWLSQNEINEKITGNPKLKEGYYYHATSLNGLEGILKSRSIWALQSINFGAFVSRFPLSSFGDHYLVLKKNIELNSPLSTFLHDIGWLGFSKAIPVNANTLAYIIVDDDNVTNKSIQSKIGTSKYCALLQQKCKRWTGGLDVLVIPLSIATPYITQVAQLKLGTLKSWGAQKRYDNKIPNKTVQLAKSPFLPSKL